MITLNDLDTYVVGDPSSGRGVVLMYDIFGFGVPPTNGNVRRCCDIIAREGNLFVVMPDFYRGFQFTSIQLNPTQFDSIHLNLNTCFDF